MRGSKKLYIAKKNCYVRSVNVRKYNAIKQSCCTEFGMMVCVNM